MIKAFAVDWGNILMFYEGLDKARASQFGVTVVEYRKVLKKHEHDFQIGAEESDFNTKMACDLKGKEPDEPYVESFKKIYKPNIELIGFFCYIRKLGYPIALATNTEKPLVPFIREKNYPIDVIVASCEIGVIKPDRLFYESIPKAFREFGINVDIGEIFFIDDDSDYVLGARAAGLSAERYINNRQIMELVNKVIGK